ncbi:hypothetical protein PM082_002831 [Marasmius tenuissimus]|nr:hypothetical protein PM082_002831 [Marasmius tenuissimus]
MLVNKTVHDVPSQLDPNGRPMRIYVISPVLKEYPHAKFPGVVVFSEIYQVTGPVERFASQIASQGYVVACPSSYHEFEGPEPLPYDTEGTDRGNAYKGRTSRRRLRVTTKMPLTRSISLYPCPTVTGELPPLECASGDTCATLGKGKNDDSLVKVRNGELTGKGELVMVFGKQDTHVPREGRDLIRSTLEDANVPVTFLEVQAQHAFIRDESSKGRYDAALTRSLFGMMMEIFDRTVARDLGPRVVDNKPVEHVC